MLYIEKNINNIKKNNRFYLSMMFQVFEIFEIFGKLGNFCCIFNNVRFEANKIKDTYYFINRFISGVLGDVIIFFWLLLLRIFYVALVSK
jgi:hypothetical protein